MPSALGTGANGFIGSHLVPLLIHRGYSVRALVRPTSDIRFLEGLPITLFIGDVREPASLERAVRDVEYIFHLAAELMVTSRAAFVESNATGTRNILAGAERCAAGSLKRFLLVSSQAAVGPGADSMRLNERSPMRPISWYGESKMLAEEAAMEFSRRIPVTIVRPPAVYGERDTDLSQVYPVIENRIHPILGFRTKYLKAVFVEDMVEGMVQAAESPVAVGQKYFLTNNELLTGAGLVRTVAEAMDKKLGLPLPVPLLALRLAAPLAELGYHFTRQRPQLTRDKAREVSQRFWVADGSKAERDLGWKARHSLLEGMRKTIPYYRRQARVEKRMAEDSVIMRWLKFVVCAAGIGAVVEILSAAGGLYRYHHWWAVLIVVGGGFGVGLGTIAHGLRRTPWLLQGMTGLVIVAVLELLNHHNLIGVIGWEFNPDRFLRALHPLLRSALVGLVGSSILIGSNVLMRQLYRRRLRHG